MYLSDLIEKKIIQEEKMKQKLEKKKEYFRNIG